MNDTEKPKEARMSLSQLYALMAVRRRMGDIGAEVVLRRDDFDAMAREVRAAWPYIEIEACGRFVINTCQGPTTVRSSR